MLLLVPASPPRVKATLEELPILARDMSADGRVFVGSTLERDPKPASWTRGSGVHRLLSNAFTGEAWDVSPDGSTILMLGKGPRSDWLYIKRGENVPRQVTKYVSTRDLPETVWLASSGQLILTCDHPSSVEFHRKLSKVDRIILLDHPEKTIIPSFGGVRMSEDGNLFAGSVQDVTLGSDYRSRAAVWDRDGRLSYLTPASSTRSSLVTAMNEDGSLLASRIGQEGVLWSNGKIVRRFPLPVPEERLTPEERLAQSGLPSNDSAITITCIGGPKDPIYSTFLWQVAWVRLPSGASMRLASYLESLGAATKGRDLGRVLRVSRNRKVLLVEGLTVDGFVTWRVSLP